METGRPVKRLATVQAEDNKDLNKGNGNGSEKSQTPLLCDLLLGGQPGPHSKYLKKNHRVLLSGVGGGAEKERF